ncbi:MAG: LysR family transcriptional regulator [Brotaphodocola sp.]
MTFEQLEAFLAAADHSNFYEAAEAVHITQSTLSKQIMKLEKELNLQLFDRSRRHAVLTAAGQHFYPNAQMLVKQYHQVLADIRQYKNLSQMELHIGTLPILNHYHLSPLLRTFAERHKEIHMTIEEVEEPALIHGLENGFYDAAIGREILFSSEQYDCQILASDQLIVLMHADHTLAHHKVLTISDLASEPLFLMHPYTSIGQTCLRLFFEAGITPHLIRTARVESIIDAVSAKEGISLLPESTRNVFHCEDLVTIALQPAVEIPVVLACPKGKLHIDL